ILNGSADLMANNRQQRHLVFTVTMRPPMLNIDDANDAVLRRCHDGHRKKCFVFIFRKCVKDFEARVLARVPRNRDWLDFLCNPTRNALSDPHRNLSNQPWMRILGCSQHQVFAGLIDEVDQARIPMRYVDNQVDYLPQYLVELERGADELTDLMQDSQFLPSQVQGFLDGFD